MSISEAYRVRLSEIDWKAFETAYGSAVPIPEQLERLASDDLQTALDASHDLWGGLCHQHAYISSAALPALPFLFDVLAQANELLAIEILDILLGFAGCTQFRRGQVLTDWQSQLRSQLSEQAVILRRLKASQNEELSGFAQAILEALDLELTARLRDGQTRE